jgi:hypothetical protein
MRRGEVGEGGIRKGRRWTGGHSTGGWGWILGALGFAERSEILGVGLYQCTGVAGGFGHGGQDIHMISWS